MALFKVYKTNELMESILLGEIRKRSSQTAVSHYANIIGCDKKSLYAIKVSIKK